MRQRRPQRTLVTFEGIAYEMDLYAVQLALVRRQVAGDFDDREQLAKAVDCSRSTLSRFCAGRQTSLRIVLAILEKLHLQFDDVYRRCDDVVPAE